MNTKKLGLLLAPLIPITAVGIVEVANELVALGAQPSPVVESHTVERCLDRATLSENLEPALPRPRPAPEQPPAPPDVT